jgi:hypothetical protein
MANTTEVRARLIEAIRGQDADGLERAVASAFQAGVLGAVSEVFVEAILLPWHHSHEDLARALQIAKDPRAVEALFETAFARYEYLDYDEFFGLARKCTWALADIGTAEARERLQGLARSENVIIARYAQKRLDQWHEELSRKGL